MIIRLKSIIVSLLRLARNVVGKKRISQLTLREAYKKMADDKEVSLLADYGIDDYRRNVQSEERIKQF